MADNKLSNAKRLATSLLEKNDLRRAQEVFEQVCRGDAADAESRYLLGIVHARLQQLDAAAERFGQATVLQPGMAMAHYALGAVLNLQNRRGEAVESLRQAVHFLPQVPEIHAELAAALGAAGRLNEARHHLQEQIRLRPTSDAYLALADLRVAQGCAVEAIEDYKAALQLEPRRADISNKLGFAYFLLGKYNEAIDCYRAALLQQPGFLPAYDNMGRALTMVGRIGEAIASLQQALAINPDYIPAAASLVAAHEMAGNVQQAGECIAPLVEKYPGNPAVVMSFLRLAGKLGRGREALGLAEAVLLQEKLPVLDRRQLHFSSGKLYDATRDYDRAFAHYRMANAIQAPHYDAVQHAREIDAIIATFSAPAIKTLPRASVRSERPVFVLGMPRSGTSLIEQILASHPGVYGAGELGDMGRILARMVSILDPAAGFPACMQKLGENTANLLAEDYLSVLHSLSPDAVRVTDKMPHNYLCLGLINLLFPDARVIHCMRDPLDTCLSIYFQYFNDGHAYSYQLGDIGAHYRDYLRLMAHWRKVLDIPMLEINYEDIVTDPDAAIRRLVAFAGLDWDPACLRFYENRRLVSTASYEQVRQPLHPNSIGRWKHYAQYLGPLQAALGKI